MPSSSPWDSSSEQSPAGLSPGIGEDRNADLVDVLASFVPAFVLRRLSCDPRPLPEPREDRFPAVVLFADIAGFTPLAERLAQRGPEGTEALSALLNSFFEQLVHCVHSHGGVVVKFAGDG